MISAALSVALVVGTALNTGNADDSRVPTNEEVIDIRVDSVGFEAVNKTTRDHVLVFGYGEARFTRALPVGASIAWPLQPGSTEGVTLELLTVDQDGFTTSGEISIDLSLVTGGLPLHLIANSAGLTGYLGATRSMTSSASAPMNAAATSSSSATTRSASFSSSKTAAGTNAALQLEQLLFHVPSVTGLDNPGPQAPPVLDDAPLPMI